MSEQLSVADRDLANFIIACMEQRGFPPSRSEIAEFIGQTSKNAAQRRVERLVRAGVIQRTPGVTRGIKVNRERLEEFG